MSIACIDAVRLVDIARGGRIEIGFAQLCSLILIEKGVD